MTTTATTESTPPPTDVSMTTPMTAPDDQDVTDAKPSCAPILLVTLQGTIAAGKSTQMAALRAHFAKDSSVSFVDEPLAEWEDYGVLKAMYKGMQCAKDGTPLDDDALDPVAFQTVAALTRSAGLFKAFNDPNVKLVISERDTYSDKYVFAGATLTTTAQKQAYELVFKSITSMFPSNLVRHHLILKLDPSTALERIKTRGREAETGVTQEYLTMLEQGHDNLQKDEDATVFDGNLSPDTLTAKLVESINQLMKNDVTDANGLKREADAPASDNDDSKKLKSK